MQRSSARRRIGNRAPLAAIELRQSATREERSRLSVLLVVHMRLVALLWIAEGLMQWQSVLTNGSDGRSGLAALSVQAIIAAVFFGVIDLVAAVGLWFAAPWGGVNWLVTAGAQLFVIATMPDFYEHPVLMGTSTVLLVAAYVALIWQVMRPPVDQPDTI